MEKELTRVVVNVPTQHVGQTMAELNRRHAYMDDVKSIEGMFTVQARVPAHELSSFKRWLEKFTNGKGEIVVADEDRPRV